MEIDAMHHVALGLVGSVNERPRWRVKIKTIVIFISYYTSSLLTNQGLYNVPHLLCEELTGKKERATP